MAAVWFRFGVELRTRWRAVFALVLLVGLGGGAALAAAAGARRADTAYTRLLADTDASQVLVNPDEDPGISHFPRRVAELPQVEEAGRVDGLAIFPADARSEADISRFGIVLASDGVVGYSFARPKILEGRMPDARHPGAVLINPVLAKREHLSVGSRLVVVALTAADLERLNSGAVESVSEALAAVRRGEFGMHLKLRVSGVGVFPDDIVVDEGFENPQMMLTPTARQRHPEIGVNYYGVLARLRAGPRAITSFRRSVEELAPGKAIAFQTTTSTEAKVERAVQPEVGALTVFAIVVALTGLLLVGQAFTRQSFLDSIDGATLRSLGGTRRQLFAVAMLRAALVASLGAAVAVILAIAVSPLTTAGAARTAEPDPGLAIDGVVLGLGSLVVIGAVLLLSAMPAWRHAGARTVPGARELIGPSRVATALGQAGVSVPMATGARMAVESGRGRTAVPVRTTIVSAGLAVASVIGAVTFAGSLDHLVNTPRLYGWNWDVQVGVAAEDPAQTRIARRDIAELLDGSGVVTDWSTVSISDVRLARGAVPAIGVDTSRRAVLPTLVSGRVPRRDDEIALGARTMSNLEVVIGDRVSARANNGDTRRLHVVGRVVLPGLGTYPGADKTSLGEGAVVTRDALTTLGPRFGSDAFVVKFRDDSSSAGRNAVLERIRRVAERTGPDNFDLGTARKPSDIVSYEQIRSMPVTLAAVLGALAVATVGHALVTSVRRRRRDLVLLETLGFTRRQVSATVAWQATTVAIAALAIGIPLGIVFGRAGWHALADNLGTAAETTVPALVVMLTVPMAVLLVNLVAFVPARMAARLRPAAVLRSE